MRSERLRFEGAYGDRLAARWEAPDAEPTTCAVFAHCFTCSKDLKAARRISRGLVDAGIAVLSFDFTGIGESEGDFADTNFSSNLDDLVAAAELVERRFGPPELLVGHSLGGAAVLAAAHRIPLCGAVATIAAPSDTSHLVARLGEAAERAEAEGEAQVVIGGRKIPIRRQLLEDLESHALLEWVAGLGKPLLIFHSASDLVVSVDHSERIFHAADHPKSLVTLTGADHLLLDHPDDAEYVARMLAVWAGRYVGGVES